jgi:hypothetical protein
MCDVDEKSPEEQIIASAEGKPIIITERSLNKILRVNEFKPINGSKDCSQIYHYH